MIILISGHVLATVAWLPLQLRHELLIELYCLKLCVREEQLEHTRNSFPFGQTLCFERLTAIG